jgi:hypothetical protein
MGKIRNTTRKSCAKHVKKQAHQAPNKESRAWVALDLFAAVDASIASYLEDKISLQNKILKTKSVSYRVLDNQRVLCESSSILDVSHWVVLIPVERGCHVAKHVLRLLNLNWLRSDRFTSERLSVGQVSRLRDGLKKGGFTPIDS